MSRTQVSNEVALKMAEMHLDGARHSLKGIQFLSQRGGPLADGLGFNRELEDHAAEDVRKAEARVTELKAAIEASRG